MAAFPFKMVWLVTAGRLTNLSDVERGARNLSLVNIERLATALALPISEVFRIVERA